MACLTIEEPSLERNSVDGEKVDVESGRGLSMKKDELEYACTCE